MKILLTAFDPFGGEPINPAWEAVRLVQAPEGAELVTLQLPTVFGVSGDRLCAALEAEKPDLVLCVGQAAGRPALTPERVAVNLMDASIPDNAGAMPREQPVLPGGPAAYFSNLPVKALARAISEASVPAAVSNSAGLFVCNQLFYRLMHEIEARYPTVRGGFLHVPCLPEQAERLQKEKELPSLPLGEIARGLQAALDFLAKNA